MTPDDTQVKPKKDRSSPYPALTLTKAVENVTQLRDKLGVGPFNRELAAKAMNYSGVSGTSSMAIAALVHYGLLERRGDTYSVSELAEDIMTPRTEQERNSSLVIAAQQPKLFRALLDRYVEQSVPTMLESVLIRDYNINRRVAASVKKTFLDTMTFVALLKNGVLLREPGGAQVATEDAPKKEEVSPSAPTSSVAASEVFKEPSATVVSGNGEMQRINISHGFSLTYVNGLPFELMTNDDFTSALRSLKQAIDVYYGAEPKE